MYEAELKRRMTDESGCVFPHPSKSWIERGVTFRIASSL